MLSKLLTADNLPSIRKAVLATLPKLSHSLTPAALLAQWNSYGPPERVSVTDYLLNRDESASKLLDAIKAGKLAARQISPAHKQKLLKHPSVSISKKAKSLLGVINSNREKVVSSYGKVAKLKGNADTGKLLFKTHCHVCHSFKGEGNRVGQIRTN